MPYAPALMTRRRPSPALAVVLVALCVVGVAGCSAPPASSSRGPISVAVPATTEDGLSTAVLDAPPGPPGSREDGGLGTADGRLPDGATVFDTYPGVARLDPALLKALRRAAADAEGDGVVLTLNSGWRSKTYQEQLLEDAVSQYGSRAKAARWVATPATSPHVSGDAVDMGNGEATTWLSRHGAAYGLCQIFRNEPWHFELRPAAATDGCPREYADPTDDPRMQR
ncbi:M15 family metallopeptidase [Oryzobacter telluris]|uniref:M15 family metallopeptidase n=1 Tax=Oryzobacter telluris TaxID=3149179 RepID=UPI00370D579A